MVLKKLEPLYSCAPATGVVKFVPEVSTSGAVPVVPASMIKFAKLTGFTVTKSVPLNTKNALPPAEIVTGAELPLALNWMFCEPPVLLITTYSLEVAGAVITRVAVPVAVHKITAWRAWLAVPVDVVRVVSASVVRVVVPATAESSRAVI
jgi:hypothetical protein